MKDILKKATHQNWVFWICLGFAIFFLTAGFFTPPVAEISGSVLTAVGELFSFSTLGAFIRALEKGVDAKVTKGDTSLTIGDLNKEEEPTDSE